jgi:rhodanese-related sulfurtransferase
MDFITHLFGQPGITQLEPTQVEGMIAQNPRPLLLDVRTPGEYKEGHIQGAELIPLNELAQKAGRIPKNREVICICHSGNRSSSAARHLVELGYKVSNMRGGMARWERAGLPIKKGMSK